MVQNIMQKLSKVIKKRGVFVKKILDRISFLEIKFL
jgi:hypothetical protein